MHNTARLIGRGQKRWGGVLVFVFFLCLRLCCSCLLRQTPAGLRFVLFMQGTAQSSSTRC
ncbi:hypothetical protein LY76DRAFT_598275 [Colletotrichum caudatum]|nr:hypothetical protein LY76DRAFT_598275 [Colletotrichum caudatum]